MDGKKIRHHFLKYKPGFRVKKIECLHQKCVFFAWKKILSDLYIFAFVTNN